MQAVEKIEIANSRTGVATFVVVALAFCAAAALLIGAFPLAASLATVFLFAGLHNFVEFRYFLARMPVAWGKSRTFYTVGIGGVLVLTAAYLTIYFTSGFLWNAGTLAVVTATWNTIFVLWVALLFFLRGRQKPRADWSFAFAVGLFVASLAWLVPHFFALALVYLHPLVALWFCDRQLRRTKREWVKPFRRCVAAIPIFLLFLWFALASAPALPRDNFLDWQIAQHAGSEILPAVSSHFLVASHVFLETIHYGVWILLIPLADRKAVPFRFDNIPLAVHRNGFPRLVAVVVVLSATAVAALWLGFATDYAVTRDVYFAVAIAHVLAEFPFLVKML